VANEPAAVGVSAPERVDELESLWQGLAPDAEVRLFYRWLDMVLRRIMADGYERAGFREPAATLRAMSPVSDERTLKGAHDVLTTLLHPDSAMDLLAAIYSALGSVRPLLGKVDLHESCFANIMASRLVYGDDRTARQMTEDIRAARNGQQQ
jgi:hypothetical protein